MAKATWVNALAAPVCPECGQQPTQVNTDYGYAVHDEFRGTAVGTFSETAWADGPWSTRKPAPDFDVITLRPCGHELRHAEMVDYRTALREALREAQSDKSAERTR